ncbi:DUF4129 domain-containing protein [Halocatena pleomorpha]|uniref:DUF4129 domain-containing protein n=1 Tax=Halocatena pleomorpha TaxID=1785090 RepID=UPI001639FC23|nr:DUF4129 domain-containing protein [Halocatena pleomorpha]
MDRHRLTPIVLALLAVVALSLSAATLDAVHEEPAGGSGEDAGVRGDGSTFDSGGSASFETGSADPAVVLLLRLLFGVVVMFGFVGLVVQVYQEGWRSLAPVVLVAVGCLLVLLAVYHALTPGSSQRSENGLFGGEQLSLPSGSPVPSGDGALSASDAPVALDAPMVLFVVLGLAVVVGLFVLRRTTGDHPLGSPQTATEADRSEIHAVGTAAGRAADSIDADAALSNAIYRAWDEMTAHLDLPRDTSTPGEFATAAVAAGMAREDVEELTQLFETTRYDDAEATERRERRARAALRRIEQAYAPDETPERGDR